MPPGRCAYTQATTVTSLATWWAGLRPPSDINHSLLPKQPLGFHLPGCAHPLTWRAMKLAVQQRPLCWFVCLSTGSDLIYNADGAHALPRVLAQLMQPQPPAVEQAQQSTSSTHALQQRTSSQQQSSSEHCSAQHQGAHEQLPACSSEGRGPSQQGPSSSRSRMVVGRHCASPAGPVMYYAHTKHR